MATTRAPDRRNPTGEVFVGADDVCRDTHLGDGLFRTEPVRQADTGVQRNRLPDRGDPRLRHPVVTQKTRGGIGAVDLEPLIAVRVVGGAKVVRGTAEEYQFVVIVDTRP